LADKKAKRASRAKKAKETVDKAQALVNRQIEKTRAGKYRRSRPDSWAKRHSGKFTGKGYGKSKS